MPIFTDQFMLIEKELVTIMERALESNNIAEIDKCIVDYKNHLGGLKDEGEGLMAIENFRLAKSLLLIERKGQNIPQPYINARPS